MQLSLNIRVYIINYLPMKITISELISRQLISAVLLKNHLLKFDSGKDSAPVKSDKLSKIKKQILHLCV